MKHLKETSRARAIRLQEIEGGKRFRSKTWSKSGSLSDPKKLRRKYKDQLRKGR